MCVCIWLKFGTLVPWVNTWGYFFIFEIFIFGALGPFSGPKLAQKPMGQPREPKSSWIWLNVM